MTRAVDSTAALVASIHSFVDKAVPLPFLAWSTSQKTLHQSNKNPVEVSICAEVGSKLDSKSGELVCDGL